MSGGEMLGRFVGSMLMIWLLALLFSLLFKRWTSGVTLAILSVGASWLLVSLGQMNSGLSSGGADGAARGLGSQIVPGVLVLGFWILWSKRRSRTNSAEKLNG